MKADYSQCMTRTSLDCRGLRCPTPIVKLSMAIRQLDAGAEIETQATDAAFHPDLLAWVGKTGHNLLEYDAGEVQRAVVRKGHE